MTLAKIYMHSKERIKILIITIKSIGNDACAADKREPIQQRTQN